MPAGTCRTSVGLVTFVTMSKFSFKMIGAFLLLLFSADCAYGFIFKSSGKRADRKARNAETLQAEPALLVPDSLLRDTLVLQGRVYCLLKDEASDGENPDSLSRETAFGESIFEPYYEDLGFDTISNLPDDFEEMLDCLLETWMVARAPQTDCVPDTLLQPASDSLYMARLALLPHVIELPYNAYVRSMIEVYTQKRRDLLSYMLGAGNYYFPIFEQALDVRDMPLELKYLPVIESALNVTAISPMGAAGLWQFMIGTGRLYGLEVNSLIDERMDPVKSTDAATRFLKDLYKVYGDWHLAIAAYNCGPGNVNKAIRRSGGKRDFWAIYPYLPRETRGYVPIFIAANYAMNYAREHNICPEETEMPLLVDTVMVTNRIHFEQLSEVLGVPKEQIRKLNPQYRRDIIPGDIRPYSLCLPLKYATAYVENCDSVCAYKADELINNRRKEIEIYRSSAPGGSGNLIYHKVRSGETLGHIALKYGTSASKIRQWNNISGSRIYVGQRLRIYK